MCYGGLWTGYVILTHHTDSEGYTMYHSDKTQTVSAPGPTLNLITFHKGGGGEGSSLAVTSSRIAGGGYLVLTQHLNVKMLKAFF